MKWQVCRTSKGKIQHEGAGEQAGIFYLQNGSSGIG